MANKPPIRYILAAIVQWIYVFFVYGFFVLLTYFPFGIIVALTARPGPSPHGEGPTEHKQKYIDQGSSGVWNYWWSPYKFLRNFNNYEDGLLGEPSGKHSARVKGKERTFWAIYQWVCRNPYNWGKRNSQMFACFVNDCDIDWWGTGDVSDKNPPVDGWYFIRAVHKETGKVYYAYRCLFRNNNSKGIPYLISHAFLWLQNLLGSKRSEDDTVFNFVVGFKIKPSHSWTKQDDDDLDKSFTIRLQPTGRWMGP